ncbi:hypothetical protein KS407_22625 [Bacillus alkalicola]|uniref:Uncharacterized protein n=1 Tax=Evansella alkalicola TaxID=745819 RepID=A0ABS6K1A6_9BACI|nr:hypothetical protein [Bacillus alkalicola]
MAFTLLFIYDYFPNVPLTGTVSNRVLIILIIGVFLLSLMFKKFNKTNNKEILAWQIIMTLYIIFLMGLFTILGGQSSAGIAFNNAFFLGVLLLSLFDMYSLWKKVKMSEA